MSEKKNTASVKSPANSLGETTENAGGQPEKWSVDRTFEENLPPSSAAKNSTVGMGSKKGD